MAHDHGWRGADYRRPVRRAGDCLRATNHQAHPPDCARACACTCVCARAPSDLPHSAHRVTPVRGLCPNARVPRLPACPPVFVHARTQAHTHTRHEASPGTLPHPRISPHSGCRPGVVLLARAVGACKGGQSWREWAGTRHGPAPTRSAPPSVPRRPVLMRSSGVVVRGSPRVVLGWRGTEFAELAVARHVTHTSLCCSGTCRVA